jgi:hypothetical protein
VKQLVFIILFSLLLKPVFPLLDYAINYEFIKTELCVNRNNTIIGCNGKCYLVKELAKASETENPMNTDKKNSVKQIFETLFLTESSNLLPNKFLFTFSNNVKNTYTNLYFYTIVQKYFHPPTFIV